MLPPTSPPRPTDRPHAGAATADARPRRPRSGGCRAAIALALAALLGCAGPAPAPEPQIDLAAEFAFTAAGRASALVDLATADRGAALLGGWAPSPEILGGRPVAWMVERRAELRLWVDDRAASLLRLRCGGVDESRPTVASGLPVAVLLNHRRVGTIRAGRALRDLEVALPPRALETGENVLGLESLVFGARHPSSEDAPRELACERVALEQPSADAAPRPRLEPAEQGGQAIVLPPGARVDFFVRAPRAAQLRLGSADGGGRDRYGADGGADGGGGRGADGAAGGALRVVVARDGGVERTAFAGALPPSAREAAIDLDVPPGEPVEISLISAGSSEVRLARAVLLGSPGRATARAGAAAPTAPAAPNAPRAAGRGAPPDRAPGAASAAAAPDAASGSRIGAPPRRPNVLLYVIDTLRADHLGCYGYPLPTSPRIDALAGEGVLFERVVAQASWTKPATASILTGRDPYAHGATSLHDAIRPEVPTLAEVLRAQGYETAAFVTNVNVSAPFGFARGFDAFTYLPEEESRPGTYVGSDELNGAVLPWLERDHDRPFFLYVHASDPHAPYAPRADRIGPFAPPGAASAPDELVARVRALQEPSASLAADDVPLLVAGYDAEVALNDSSLGALLDALERRGLDRNTLVVVTADHGEEFLEHGGLRHGRTLYEEVIRVPLVVRQPDRSAAGRRRADLAAQVDILPTVLAGVGVGVPDGVDGRPLFAAADSPDDPGDAASREARSHTRLYGVETAAVSTERWKVVHRALGPRRGDEVFELDADPRERRSVADRRRVLAGYGLEAIARAAGDARRSPPPLAPVDAATGARLRSLGYLP